jgi:dTDP-glucose 4,6-dehydratase
MKKYFVTGGAGFIGSAFIRLLLERDPNCQVTNFDALTYAGNRDNIAELDQSRHRFVHGNIVDKEVVIENLEADCDAIIHFAAESHVDRSIASAYDFVQTNVLGTQVLLDAARLRGAKRFVHISTDEVMGSLPEADGSFFTESSKLEPNTP